MLELDLQMPGRTWKHLQFVGYEFADTYPGVGSICNLLELDLQMHILGSEASATCWNWICRCLVGVGSICNLLELDLQMPGQDRKHLQFASIGLVDACPGSEVSAICWYWTCRYQSWVRKHPQFADIGLVDTDPGIGSICNLLELDL